MPLLFALIYHMSSLTPHTTPPPPPPPPIHHHPQKFNALSIFPSGHQKTICKTFQHEFVRTCENTSRHFDVRTTSQTFSPSFPSPWCLSQAVSVACLLKASLLPESYRYTCKFFYGKLEFEKEDEPYEISVHFNPKLGPVQQLWTEFIHVL